MTPPPAIGGPTPEPADLPRQIADALSRGESLVVATVIETRRSVPRHAGSKMLLFADGRTMGSVGGGEMEARVVAEAPAVLADGRPKMIDYSLVNPAAGDPGVCGGDVELLLEPMMSTPTLFVVGAGHVGKAVCDLARWLGFRAVVWDDRSEATQGIEHAAAIHTGSIAEALEASPVSPHDCIVVVTRNVDLDVDILPALLGTTAGYVGVMGSDRRWSTTRARLAELGLTEDQLERVQNPIGVEINAETPEEIAVSILAEVIAHQRQAAGGA